MGARSSARIEHRAFNQYIDWDGFKQFIYTSYVPKTADDYWRYARKFCHLLINRDFSPLKLLTTHKRLHAMYSLSALSKFLGIHREFKSLRESYGLKWSKGNTDQLIIKRLLRGKNGDELGDWIREVKNRIPGISNFVDLLLSTGLRYCEAINAYNLIMDDREDYYRDSFLEHYRYPTLFIRRTKKVFVSIVPSSLVNRISKSDRLTDDMIKKRLQRRKIPLRFSDIRELWASRMTRYLTQPEIDFLMGHVSANVFMANYFNIALITDLRKRTLRGINRIL